MWNVQALLLCQRFSRLNVHWHCFYIHGHVEHCWASLGPGLFLFLWEKIGHTSIERGAMRPRQGYLLSVILCAMFFTLVPGTALTTSYRHSSNGSILTHHDPTTLNLMWKGRGYKINIFYWMFDEICPCIFTIKVFSIGGKVADALGVTFRPFN